MKHIIENKQEEQLMIMIVSLHYQDRDTRILEEIGKSLYNIHLDVYKELPEDLVFEYVDTDWTYERMVEEGAVAEFRKYWKEYERNYE